MGSFDVCVCACTHTLKFEGGHALLGKCATESQPSPKTLINRLYSILNWEFDFSHSAT